MKKEFHHTDMHPTVKCRYCNKKIKARLVVIKEKVPEECYIHFMARKCRERGRKLPVKIEDAIKKDSITMQHKFI